jgi:hypothetical protein
VSLIEDHVPADRTALADSQTDAIRATLADGSASLWDLVRAFGVTVGPSVALDATAAASLISTVRSLRRGRRPSPAAALGVGLLGAYTVAVRPRMLRWGATDAEASSTLPGDELVPDPGAQCTRAVTIDAPVESVWPWLAQIGQDRAGFYSHELLENLAGCRMHNASEIHPEWQHRQIGETVMLHHLYGLPVARFEPGRVLALNGWGAFITEPFSNDCTRLICRGRTARGPGVVLGALLIEIPHFVMERKMMLAIKHRAEAAWDFDRRERER